MNIKKNTKFKLNNQEVFTTRDVQIDSQDNEDEDMTSAVSDILGQLSKGKISGKYGHIRNFYPKNLIEKEAFANFFDAGMSYKPLKQMYIQEVFPNAHKVFEQMVTDGLKKEPYTTIPHQMIVV